MDEDNKPKEPAGSQWPQHAEPIAQNPFPFTGNTEATQNTDSTNDQQYITEPMSSSELEEIANAEKQQEVDKSLVALLAITFAIAGLFVALILVTVLALLFVPSSRSIAGLSTVIAIYLVGPPLLIFGIITLIKVKRAKAKGQKIGKAVRKAGFFLFLPPILWPILKSKNKRVGKAAIVVVVIFGIVGIFMPFLLIKLREEHDVKAAEERNQQLVERRKSETISISYASELLNGCKLKWVKYGDAIKEKDGIESELSKDNEGVALTKDYNGDPFSIYIAKRAETQLLPLAKKAENNCYNFAISDK